MTAPDEALARFVVGDVFEVLDVIPDGSVQSVITSPPYWRKRRYLPVDHPDAAKEIGQESSPGEFLATLLRLTDELWRVVADDGTIWFNLGDTAAGSGGAGGDYNPGGQRTSQNRFNGSARSSTGARSGADVPRPKSVCWIPELFGASLAYGRNLLTGEPCRQWITRPPVVWCKPAPTPGEIIDKFREATELFVWASKQPRYYFDLDAIREAPKNGRQAAQRVTSSAYTGHPDQARVTTRPDRVANPKGVPPLTWWVVNTSSYEGAHFATFPPEIITRPVIASCPPRGTILDPFAGTGTVLAVATGHGRRALGIDIDVRNAELARDRVGMFLEVDQPAPTAGRAGEAPDDLGEVA